METTGEAIFRSVASSREIKTTAIKCCKETVKFKSISKSHGSQFHPRLDFRIRDQCGNSSESQNHIGWKRPLRSSSPTINLTLPKPPLHHVHKHLMQTSFKYLQGWGLNHFPGQPVPMLDNPLGEVKFPHIQSKPPLAQLEAISSHPITCYLGEETDPTSLHPPFSDKVSPQPPFLQAEQPQVPQPLLIRLLLQTLHQLRCPSLDTLQPLNVPLVVGGPKLNTAFEVQPHQCRVQGHDHCPSPAGHAIFDTSQDAIGFLGRLGTLLAHIQAAVDQHHQVLLCRAAFQPLFPKPVALHGVAVAQVQDLALGLVEPHTIDLGPSIQPVQVPLQSLPTLQQINPPAQLGPLVQPSCKSRDIFNQIRLLRAPSSLALSVSRDGASTTSLGNLGQCLTTLSPMEETMVKAGCLWRTTVEQISTMQPVEDPTLQQREMPEGSCSPWRSHSGASFLAETVGCWGSMLEQSIPEGLQPMERAHAGAVHEGWYPVGGTPHWSRGRAILNRTPPSDDHPYLHINNLFFLMCDKVDSPAEKPLYTNACSMGNEQEELEVTVQLESYGLIVTAET
ncbi:hypothetical protein QYF61_004647 [Mycteria americana]|uniref:Uncharacterized protein n=1 Tax=Mycteria americana TaxID=33587 RepID=A0AAN7MUZ4_MYCAM|nr:hypothetical protein QYF61_004647 [Mycteria americana]